MHARTAMWAAGFCLAALASGSACGGGIRGWVRGDDGRVRRERLDMWQLTVARRSPIDISCPFERVVVARVVGTERLVVSGCGRSGMYSCQELPRLGVACHLESVRADGEPDPRTAGAAISMLAPRAGPPQVIEAIGTAPSPSARPAPPSARPPRARGRASVRSELGDPRTSARAR